VIAVIELLGVSGVERNPQKNELAVSVVGLFGTVQPAQGPMDTQRQAGGVFVAHQAVALFERVVIERSADQGFGC